VFRFRFFKELTILKVIDFYGKELKIMKEITDEKYGRVWNAYYDHEKVWIVEGKIIEDPEIIDDLDNKYGRPVSDRFIEY